MFYIHHYFAVLKHPESSRLFWVWAEYRNVLGSLKRENKLIASVDATASSVTSSQTQSQTFHTMVLVEQPVPFLSAFAP